MKNERSLQEIIDLASAYYGSAVLFAALECKVFELVENTTRSATANNLALNANLDRRGLRLLLDACVSLGLMHKEGEVYANTAAAKLALVPGGGHDLTGAIMYNRDVYPAWHKLSELVHSGQPVEAPSLHLGDDAARTRRFALAMHGRALGIGRALIPFIKVDQCERLLDLAGGPGTYAVLLAQANPNLHCDTVDLPAISQVAEELVAQSNVAQRVTCLAGDYHSDEFQAEYYDAVTIFGALHQETPAMIIDILTRAFRALKPGGEIFILDMMTDTTHTRPVFSALFALNMALTTHNGWVFADSELHAWLKEAGFKSGATMPMPAPMPHWLVSARKLAPQGR